MSVDCRAIVKHPDRSRVDAAVLRLLQAAAAGGDEPSAKKREVWVKTCVKMLRSAGGKHRNFFSANQPAIR